ncbi:MAG TPA: rhombotarget lipoprotein [Telluria sp.]|nr:rhombotarget lipoprotein [Telluria sp.]
MRILRYVLAALLATTLAACGSMTGNHANRQSGSVVDYLYPDAKEAPAMQPTVTVLRTPVRVGIAFAPGHAATLSETEKLWLLEKVRSSFSQHQYIGSIEIIPSAYLRPRGGWGNLEQAARMFNVDVVALLSYDQVTFNDTNRLAVLYWTIVGAYLIKGDRYDIQTMVDASVFDVKSRKLLFRAPGTSQVKGSATMAGYGEQSRAAQTEGYNKAVDQLIPALQNELASFKERIKSDAGYQIVDRDGRRGGGSFGWAGAVAALLAGCVGYGRLRRSA